MKMKFMFQLSILCFLLAVPVAIGQERPLSPSLIELLASPERFDGKLVTVRGFLLVLGGRHDIIGYVLYLHKEDAENALANSVSVTPNEQMGKDREKIDRMYVSLTGTVRRVPTATGEYSTVIKDVSHCTPWSDPNHPVLLRTDNKRPSR
jgi:hypothetical protein